MRNQMQTPWTKREIERSVAFRRRENGEIVVFEICAGCKNGFLKSEHKLGYGTGRALCRNCTSLERVNTKHNEEPFVLNQMGRGVWLVSQLARTCKMTQDATEQVLVNLLDRGLVERNGRSWKRREVQTSLFK